MIQIVLYVFEIDGYNEFVKDMSKIMKIVLKF